MHNLKTYNEGEHYIRLVILQFEFPADHSGVDNSNAMAKVIPTSMAKVIPISRTKTPMSARTPRGPCALQSFLSEMATFPTLKPRLLSGFNALLGRGCGSEYSDTVDEADSCQEEICKGFSGLCPRIAVSVDGPGLDRRAAENNHFPILLEIIVGP